MVITRESLQTEIDALRKQERQLFGQYQTVIGSLQAFEFILKRLDESEGTNDSVQRNAPAE